MARIVMVPIRESVSSSELAALRRAAEANDLEAAKINGPSNTAMDEKLSP